MNRKQSCRRIAKIVDKHLKAGSYPCLWYTRDICHGKYVVALKAEEMASVKKVVLLR